MFVCRAVPEQLRLKYNGTGLQVDLMNSFWSLKNKQKNKQNKTLIYLFPFASFKGTNRSKRSVNAVRPQGCFRVQRSSNAPFVGGT